MAADRIPAGFQQTEVGVIPVDWEIVSMAKICQVKSGKRLPKGNSLSDKETEHPYIRVSDMFMGGVSLSEIKYVPEEVFPAIKNYRIYADEIFISVAGTLGIVGKIAQLLDGANLTENANKITNIDCDRDYLMYVLMSFLIQNKVETERTLGAQPKLALTRIRNFQIPLPPTLAEQTAIATALSDMDALIEGLERLIGKKRGVKQGAMQALLTGKRRLAGFGEGQGMQRTEVGVVPGDWEVANLGNLIRLKNGFAFSSKYFSKQGPIVLTPGNFKLDGGLYFNEANTKRYSGEYSSSTIFDPNDLLIVMTDLTPDCNLLGKPAFVDIKEPVLHNQRIGKVEIPRDNLSKDYLYWVFLSRVYLDRIKETATGSTVRHTSNKSIYSTQLPLPPTLAEQRAIARALSDMDAEIGQLEVQRAKYRRVKEGMMQELLTGKKRLV